jgi:hypothetical protein
LAEDYSSNNVMPVAPKYIADAAKKALEIRKELPPSRQYGTLVGLARANQLANGENISDQTLVRMRSYLLRAKENYRSAKSQGRTAKNSKAIGAYLLWGGPRALAWVNEQLKTR